MQFDISATSVAADASGLASGVSGASWALTATDSGDSLAHKITVTGGTATNHSAKTTTISGTGPDGESQSESINLPNGTATVTTSKYYLSVTSPIVPSTTIGTDTMNIGWAAASVTPSQFLNTKGSWSGVGFGCAITNSPTYGVQVAYGNTWHDHATVTNETTNQYGEIAQPVQAIRVVFTAAGGVALTGIQANA